MPKPPPPEFFREFEPLRRQSEWLELQGKRAAIAELREMVTGYNAFLDRWQPRIFHPSTRTQLATLRAQMQTMARRLELHYLASLQEAVEARRKVGLAEAFLEGAVLFSQLAKISEARPDLERIYRESMGEEYVAEKEYREVEADADAADAEFRRSLAEFAADWPDRVDAALRQRLAEADAPALKAWAEEIQAEVARVQKAIGG